MRLWPQSRNRKTLPAVVQEVRGTKERTEEEGGREKYENGEPTRGPEISKRHVRIYGENRFNFD